MKQRIKTTYDIMYKEVLRPLANHLTYPFIVPTLLRINDNRKSEDRIESNWLSQLYCCSIWAGLPLGFGVYGLLEGDIKKALIGTIPYVTNFLSGTYEAWRESNFVLNEPKNLINGNNLENKLG